jgi:two-component SAPR family response regulator
MMSKLCAHALRQGIEVNYVKELIRHRGLTPPDAETEDWPWPVKIYALGRFSVVIDDEPLRSEGKAQKRPLDLLKAILAHGGRGVNQDDLANLLWPDLDAARSALEVTLHRLRTTMSSACRTASCIWTRAWYRPTHGPLSGWQQRSRA